MFFKTDFEAKVKVANMFCKVSYGEAEALSLALEKWDECDKLQEELEFVRQYIHDNGLEWDLLSKYKRFKDVDLEEWKKNG